jgi:hypothetical protein
MPSTHCLCSFASFPDPDGVPSPGLESCSPEEDRRKAGIDIAQDPFQSHLQDLQDCPSYILTKPITKALAMKRLDLSPTWPNHKLDKSWRLCARE